MKNKKLLLTIAMIMSLVMSVSCSNNGNQTTDPNGPNTPPPAKEDVIASAPAKTDALATTDKVLEVKHSDGSPKTDLELTLEGADGKKATVDGSDGFKVSLVSAAKVAKTAIDSSDNTTATSSNSIDLGDVTADNIDFKAGTEAGKIKINVKSFNDVKGGLANNKYGALKLRLKVEAPSKTAKEFDMYILIKGVEE